MRSSVGTVEKDFFFGVFMGFAASKKYTEYHRLYPLIRFPLFLCTCTAGTRLSQCTCWSITLECRKPQRTAVEGSFCTTLYILWAAAVTASNPRLQGVCCFSAGGKRLVLNLFPLEDWTAFMWCGKMHSVGNSHVLSGREKRGLLPSALKPVAMTDSCVHPEANNQLQQMRLNM